MKSLLLTTRTIIAVGIWSFGLTSAFARTTVEASPPLHCGTIRNLSGVVSILDSERKDFREVLVGGDVFCGDWISTENGKIVLEFPDRGKVIIGANTFFQILDPAAGENVEHDHFVLYRGDLYFDAAKDAEPSRLVTPNARLTLLKDGKSIVSFLEVSQATQAISLEGAIEMQNRFLKHEPWRIERGYLSNLAQGTERVLPGRQMTAEAKSLDDKLIALEIPSDTRKSIVDFVATLAKKKLVVKLGDFSKNPNRDIGTGPRATETLPERSDDGYGRRPASETYSAIEGVKLKNERRSVASEPASPSAHAAEAKREEFQESPNEGPKEKLKKDHRAPASAGKKVSRSKGKSAPEKSSEAEEKRKVLENLSRIQEEDT